MINDYFKVKSLKQEDYIKEIDKEADNEEIEIKLVFDKNSKIINKESHDKLFKDKDLLKENLKRKNPYSNEGNQQIKQKKIIDPEKRQYMKMTPKQLEEQIEQITKNIKELKNKPTNKEEIEKYKKLTDKWLKISQESIYTILELFPHNQSYEKNTIKSVLNNLKIDKEMLNYNSEEDCFD